MTANGTAVATELPITPLYDYVLLEPILANKTDGGLHLPQKVAEKSRKSRVVKAGPGRLNPYTGQFVENTLKVGDVVYHMSMHEPFVWQHGGKDYLLMSAEYCVAKE